MPAIMCQKNLCHTHAAMGVPSAARSMRTVSSLFDDAVRFFAYCFFRYFCFYFYYGTFPHTPRRRQSVA